MDSCGTPGWHGMKRRNQAMGCHREFVALREKYKGEGLEPREAKRRAYIELGLEERWREFLREHGHEPRPFKNVEEGQSYGILA